MPEGLKIQVGADVQQAVKALSQDIPKAAGKAADSFQQLSKTISSDATVIFSKKIPVSINTASNSIKDLADKIKREGASGFKILGESGQLAGSKLRSLSGVLQTTATTIPVLTSAANNSKDSLLKFAAAFGVGNLAGNLLIGVLSELADAIFGTGKLFSEAELAAGEFGNTLKSIKNDVESLKKSLSFQSEIKKLGFQLSGLSGNELSIAGGFSDIALNTKGVASLDEKIKQLTQTQKGFLADIDKINAPIRRFSRGGQSELDKLVSRFGSIENIPEGFIKKLDEQGFSAVSLYRKTNDEIKILQKERNNFLNDTAKEIFGIGISFNNEIKKQQESLARIQTPSIKKQIETELRPALGSIRIELPTIFDTESADARSRFSKQLADLEKNIRNTGKPIVLPVRINLSPEAEKNQQDLKRIQAFADETGKIYGDALQAGLSNGISGFGEGIGKALAGGSIGDAFNNFLTAIGGALQAMGEQLVAIGVAALLAKEALSNLFSNPAIAIAAGVALTAAGAALKGLLAGGIRGFAQGGLVTGPQLALIGEGAGTSRSNPEVVAPLDKLKGMLAGMGGGGSQTIYVTGRLRGNDMLLQNARTSRSQRRTTGR